MTIIEIFDKEPLNNILSSLKFFNDKVIYIGFGKTDMSRGIENIKSYFDENGIEVEIDILHVIKNNMPAILEELEKLVISLREAKEEFYFDLTGGSDIVLVAMGIMAERYSIPMFSMDIERSKVIWQMNKPEEIKLFEGRCEISVRDNILIHGGDVVGPFNIGGIFTEWDYNEDFFNDIYNMWEICRKDCTRWNREISELQQYCSRDSALIIGKANRTMDKLVEIGILHQHNTFKKQTFTFKNDQIRESLMKVGNVLELYTGLVAKEIIKEDGSIHFNDVKVGVSIDWDGIVHDIHDLEKDTRNEVDVVLMKGTVPIFISCKNGDVTIDELYKLKAVGDKFGGRISKKVLVSTVFGKKGSSFDYFVQRAKDMNIVLLDDVHKYSKEDFVKRLVNL